MGKIEKLSKQLTNQIAAGEVVERPLSVVKELLENSLDADAENISIRLGHGGIGFIEVQDSGEGIEKEDFLPALEKYSTSKIRNLEDLYHVMSYGFRGEALASISSVSEFTLISKTRKSLVGHKLFTQGGEEISLEETSAPEGTKIRVENLFFNTPARKSYLKTEKTEYAKILDFVQKMALAYPEKSFSLEHNHQKVFEYSQISDLSGRIFQVYGKEFLSHMISVEYMLDSIRVFGYISSPKISFSNKNKHIIFVNQRLISSPTISQALYQAYNRFIPHGTFPAYILFLDIDPTQIDVNVHPRKLEIRFAQEDHIFRAFYHAVISSLEKVSVVSVDTLSQSQDAIQTFSSQNRETPFSQNPTEKYYVGSGTKFKNYSPYKDIQHNPAQEAIRFSAAIFGKNNTGAESSFQNEALSHDLHDTPLGKIIGQSHNSYIILQREKSIVILDQHAIAERVNYEKLASSSGKFSSQYILGGISLHLDPLELSSFQQYSEVFENLGFQIEVFPQGNILINAIPDFIKKENLEKVFRLILGDISHLGSLSLDEVRHKIWAYIACRSAIKFGDPLTLFEMNALLKDASLDYSATCPHGRPVVWEISLDELQKKYER